MTLPLIAILRGVSPQRILSVADILISEGFHMLEIPLNSPDALKSIHLLTENYLRGQQHVETTKVKLLLGAGTVTNQSQARAALDNGANFIVSPNFNEDVIRTTKQSGAYMCCGVLTPTEAFGAIAAGADCLKLFPANILGADGLKALRSVLPSGTLCFPVGGIDATEQSMLPFFEAGADGFGLGSSLFQASMSDSEVRSNAKRFTKLWKSISV